jgi:hypothetical protein
LSLIRTIRLGLSFYPRLRSMGSTISYVAEYIGTRLRKSVRTEEGALVSVAGATFDDDDWTGLEHDLILRRIDSTVNGMSSGNSARSRSTGSTNRAAQRSASGWRPTASLSCGQTRSSTPSSRSPSALTIDPLRCAFACRQQWRRATDCCFAREIRLRDRGGARGAGSRRPLFARLVKMSTDQSTAVASSITRNCAGSCVTPRMLVA